MGSDKRKLPRLTFKHVLSGFSGKLETDYYEDFFRTSLPVVRIALILGVALYSLFGILDIWIVPIHRNEVWIIRYAIVCPALIVTLILTFTKYFMRSMQIIMSSISFIAGFGIVITIALSLESELGFRFYYAGLMLVLMWIYTLVRLHFTYATAVSLIITISYEVVALGINKLLSSTDNTILFVNNNFFFISANIIGMFASFTIEWYMRKNFLLRMEIQKAYNLNQTYLDHIKEGLLLVDEDSLILNKYSKYLTGMFERQSLEGLNFVDLVYPDTPAFAEERLELQKFIKFMFHNKSADLEMIMDLNPFKNKKITIKSGDYVTKEITVNADFIRISSTDRIEYLMVIFEDITEFVKYEKEIQGQKTRYQQEVESVTAILKSGPGIFSDFLDESTVILNSIKQKVHKLDQPDILNQVFRDTHSLKGSAKHLDLNFIASISHEIEDILVTCRDNPERQEIPLDQIDSLIIDLFHEFQNLSKMIERLKVFSAMDLSVKSTDYQGHLGEFLNSLPPMVETLCGDLKKNAKLEIDNSLPELPQLPKLKNPLIHLIRNSVDHGIEDQFERLTKNKPAMGKISLRLYSTEDSYVIEVEDDGSGINFEGVRRKALEKNWISAEDPKISNNHLLQFIFKPSFSSRDVASQVSGRGYGLDIVKDAMDQLKGKIAVSTKKDKGTKISLTFPHG